VALGLAVQAIREAPRLKKAVTQAEQKLKEFLKAKSLERHLGPGSEAAGGATAEEVCHQETALTGSYQSVLLIKILSGSMIALASASLTRYA
jgi:hypothetical protein